MNKKRIALLLGCVVTVAALWYSTRNVRLKDFLGDLRRFHYIWLVPALVTFYYSMYLRAVRWGLLFRPYYKLSGARLFRPIMICFGFNSLFPARVGEFMRAYYVGRREGTGIPRALATVLAERIIDGATLLGLLAVSLWSLPKLDSKLSIALWGFNVSAGQFNALTRKLVTLTAILVVAVAIFIVPWTQRVLTALIQRSPLSERLRHKLSGIMRQFVEGFHSIHNPWVLAQILFHSLVLWVLVAVSNMTVAWGFDIPMDLRQSCALMTFIGIFILIPAAPGYWGLFELGAIFSLRVLGLVKADQQSLALACAMVVHLVQYIPLVVFGLLFAWQAQMKPAEELDEVIAEEEKEIDKDDE